jgi:hypothetical protein
MSKHPKYIEGFNGSLEELVKAVGNMTYDQVAIFIEKLAENIEKQGEGDLTRGRKKLASATRAVSEKLYEAKDKMDLVWKICEPYMKD